MHPLLRHGYLLMAAVAGSVTALAFQKWKVMSWGEVGLTLFVGASFAIFVTPILAEYMLGTNASPRAIAALSYISAAGSNVLIPVCIGWVRRITEAALSAEKTND